MGTTAQIRAPLAARPVAAAAARGRVPPPTRPQESQVLERAGESLALTRGYEFGAVTIHPVPSIRVQPKLAINEPGDVYEQEADRVAEQVMQMPDPTTQSRPRVASGKPSIGTLQRKKCTCGGTPGPTGECESCRKKREAGLQRKEAAATNSQLSTLNSQPGDAPPIVHEVLRSPGQPLDAATRAFFEPRFGHDLSNVRVHSDSAAARAARAVNANAFAVGRDIVFGANRFSPESHNGRQLIAHELTHVLQQRAGGVCNTSIHARASQPRLMRDSVVLDGKLEQLCHRVAKGQTIFPVSEGGLVITADLRWIPSDEWESTGPRNPDDLQTPECGDGTVNITVTQRNSYIDDDYGRCAFAVGGPVTQHWANLPKGDYYLTFATTSTTPNCCIAGDVLGVQKGGLRGEKGASCTIPPPGPMEVMHDALMAAGLLPGIGIAADGVDLLLYAIEGDWGNVGFSAAAMIPIFGDAAALGKAGSKFIKIEGKAVTKLGKIEITKGLKAIKVGKRLLKRPTYKAYRATAAIDERLLEIALEHRAQLVGAGQEFGSHNIAVMKVLIDGNPAYMSARNIVGELHSEARLIQQVDAMIANKKSVEVLQIFSERIPCSRAGCMMGINAKYPKADVFYSVSEELAESAGSKAKALRVVYGLKP